MTMPTEPILSRSLASELVVGSNRRGDLSGAGWLYALPRLEFGLIVCVGAPSAPTLAALVRSATTVLVADSSTRRRDALDRQAREAGWTSVRTVGDRRGLATALDADAAPGLAVIGDARHGEWSDMASLAIGRLGADGLAWLPSGALSDPAIAGAIGDAARLTVALTPARGEVRSTVPATDGSMRAAIRRLGLDGTLLQHPRLARIERQVRDVVAIGPRTGGRTAVIVGPRPLVDDSVPAYIRDLAAASGFDLGGWRWAVAARGDYDSQKVLVLLAPPDATAPSGIVKVTRSPEHAARLENEARALEGLGRLPVADGRAPRHWFDGRHAGRALLGESAVDGVPFPVRAQWRRDCPHLADAVGWLTDLAVATRRPVPASSVASTLLALLERYAAIHRPSAAEADSLRSMFASLADLSEPLATVLQHGDPGIWNLLVDRDGRTIFLDWEAAEPDGLPLWDLFYLFRSYAVRAGKRSGMRSSLQAAATHLLGASPLGERLVDVVATYRERVALPAAAVEPLLYGCWMHRSLKEATRMAPERLADGQFVRLIRRMLADPNAPTLAALAGRAG
jgi:hypothetical protein